MDFKKNITINLRTTSAHCRKHQRNHVQNQNYRISARISRIIILIEIGCQLENANLTEHLPLAAFVNTSGTAVKLALDRRQEPCYFLSGLFAQL